jgi:16S rRNA (cytosine967-C5)-methyltransferase
VSGPKPREIAARILQRRREGDFVEHLLEAALAEHNLAPADRHLCQELVYGIVRWEATLDWLVARRTTGRTQKPALQVLLRLGLYQIFWLDRIPPHAAVHETVELARTGGFGPQSGFVNALLRGYLRAFAETRKVLEELKVTQPHLGYSHPEWLVRRWQERWGTEKTAQLLAWNNSAPKTYARVNRLKTEAGSLLEQWRQEGVEYDFIKPDWVDDHVIFLLKSHPPFRKMPSFQQGKFYLQDPSTLLSVAELGPAPGESILDLCAAPGGKLSYIAQLTGNQGRLVAHDVSTERLEQVKENAARLGLASVEPVTSETLPPSERFDRVLVDAPCSNTGVMRRRVDLRWRVRPEEVTRLRQSQIQLLQQAFAHLRPGGVLVYSTCSLEPEENRMVVRDFLSTQPWLRLDRERELLPFEAGVDGAYTARLIHTGGITSP